MIINKIILNNFYRYYGRQAINCEVNDKNNVIVIIGKNGRGKTTIISAFQWVFYGKVSAPLTIESMMNDNRLKEMSKNEGDNSYVEVEFTDNNQTYIVRRSQHFIKESEGIARKKGSPELKFYNVDINGNKKELDVKENYTNKIIPEKLSGFFFFDGERIDRLAKVDGKKEIKQAILDTLGITSIENAQSDLNSVEKLLYNDLKKYDGDKESKGHTIMLEQLMQTEDQRKKQLKSANIKVEQAQNIIEDCNEKLRTSNSNEVKKLEKRRRELEVDETKIKNSIAQQNNKIANHISENFKYHLISKNYEIVEKMLEEKRQKGQLPSNIKITFIDDLINRGTCICGCNLNENAAALKNVNELKNSAGKSELDEAYTKIKGLIDNAKNGQGKNFYKILDILINTRSNLFSKQVDIQEELKRVNTALKNVDSEEIKRIETIRDDAKEDYQKYSIYIGRLQEQIISIRADIEKTKKRIKESQSNNAIVLKKKKQLDTIDKIRTLNNEFKNLFIRKVREELDERIKSVFSEITNKEFRVPELNEKFELKIKSKLKGSEKDEILSTGEGQITSLSFIGALVSYARDSKKLGIMSKFMGDEYPIVMDSPFGNLDEIHTENVAKNIGKLASQVIIIVSNKQWKGHVEDNILSQVNRKYLMLDGDTKGGEYAEYTYIEEIK